MCACDWLHASMSVKKRKGCEELSRDCDTPLCLSDWVNNPYINYIIPRKYTLCLWKHNFIPGNIFSVRKYLFGCAGIYIPALNIFMSAHISLCWPGNILVSRRKLFIARKYVSIPRNICLVPEIYCVSCTDFLVLPFLGLPVCLDYINDQLLATSAP